MWRTRDCDFDIFPDLLGIMEVPIAIHIRIGEKLSSGWNWIEMEESASQPIFSQLSNYYFWLLWQLYFSTEKVVSSMRNIYKSFSLPFQLNGNFSWWEKNHPFKWGVFFAQLQVNGELDFPQLENSIIETGITGMYFPIQHKASSFIKWIIDWNKIEERPLIITIVWSSLNNWHCWIKAIYCCGISLLLTIWTDYTMWYTHTQTEYDQKHDFHFQQHFMYFYLIKRFVHIECSVETACSKFDEKYSKIKRKKRWHAHSPHLLGLDVRNQSFSHGLVDRMVVSIPIPNYECNIVVHPKTSIRCRIHMMWHHLDRKPNSVTDPSCCANDVGIRLLFYSQVFRCHYCMVV